MNKLVIKIIITVLFALVLGFAISLDPGYVLIRYKNFQYVSGLWTTIAIIASIFFIIWLILSLLGISFELLGKVNPFSSIKKQRFGEQGLRELAEGKWDSALKHLSAASKGSYKSLAYYLGAAQAANEIGEYEKSNAFIEQACEYAPKSKVAIGLHFANLLINRQDYDKALSVAQELYSDKPHHPQVIKQLYDIYLQQKNWTAINQLLPSLTKHKLLPEDIISKLEIFICQNLLQESFTNNKSQPIIALEQLKKVWNSLSKDTRNNISIIEVYIKLLCSLNGHVEAETVLQKTIDKNYQSPLVYLYGQIQGNDINKQIDHAEHWLKEHSNDPVLLLTLGKLCQKAQLWGKTKEYLEKSISLDSSSPAAYLELAGYLSTHDKNLEKSNKLFQDGLKKIHNDVYLSLDKPND